MVSHGHMLPVCVSILPELQDRKVRAPRSAESARTEERKRLGDLHEDLMRSKSQFRVHFSKWKTTPKKSPSHLSLKIARPPTLFLYFFTRNDFGKNFFKIGLRLFRRPRPQSETRCFCQPGGFSFRQLSGFGEVASVEYGAALVATWQASKTSTSKTSKTKEETLLKRVIVEEF